MRRMLLLLWLLIPTAAGAEPLQVYVSVLPQKGFIKRVGGSHVEVHVVVQPGQSPATYEPTPRQVTALGEADIYVRAGVPFENAWMRRIRSANARMRILDAHEGIDLRILEHHHENDHGHGDRFEYDPHLWTSPPLVKQMARNIRDKLIELDPDNSKEYRDNFTAFAAELDALDLEIRTLLKDLSNRRFMVFHPAWGYFAKTYELTQIPIEKEGKQPGARALTALINQARQENVKIIFVQPQFDKKLATRIAQAIGGRVETLDPLSPAYIENMRRVAALIAEAARP